MEQLFFNNFEKLDLPHLKRNAHEFKRILDQAKVFYVSLDADISHQRKCGDGHAVVVDGYRFNQQWEMKLLVIDSNYGYGWVDLEHLSASLQGESSGVVSKET